MLKNINNSNSEAPLVYIAHGLNQKISIWDNWVEDIENNISSKVILSQLKGHSSDESLNNSSYRLWCKQIESDLSRIFAISPKKPIHILAYSLGALLVVDVLLKNNYQPDKLVLIAPAFKPHFALSLIPNLSNKSLKKIKVPSLSPKHSRVHNSISLYIYKEIHRASERVAVDLHKLKANELSVIMDKKDELLNGLKTKQTLENSGLSFDWTWVESQGQGLGKHHLLPANGYLSDSLYNGLISKISSSMT
ncbi:MAG: alpha/beta hydrolase [Bdellovibrionales bacterium]|nr:alpha/beta hydrolase [Bdellovibrionales bacterium]